MKNFKTLIILLGLVVSISLTGCNSAKPLTEDPIVLEEPKVNTEETKVDLKTEEIFVVQDHLSADILLVKDLNGIDESKLNNYKIDVDLNTDDMSYIGKQNVSYVNNADIDLKDLYFHVYPNAFKKIESDVPGYIEIKKVSSKDDNLEYNIEGEQETILHIKLKEPIKKGKTIELYLEYKVKFPSSTDRFGYHDKGINCGNWYPIACVYDKTGWNLDPYYELGDPFYSETSNYQVCITAPKEMIIAASGGLISEELIEDKRVYNFEGKLIRDFAWAASKQFKTKEKLVEGTIIKVYSVNDDIGLVDRGLDVGEKSIKAFNKVFGKYPYGQYSIVITEFPGGMEYPGLVFIVNYASDKEREDPLEVIIAHETGHQWWYGLVGNDQIDEAWLDEALTTYSEVIYMNEVYGKSKGEDYYEDTIRSRYVHGGLNLKEDNVVNKTLSEFKSWNDYGILVYTRGSMLLERIKKDFGEEVLYEILSSYFERYKFHIATTEDFIKVCEEVTNKSFDLLVKEYLNGGK